MGNYELQWRYIKNFIQYIEWPNQAADMPVTLCVAGPNPFDELPKQIRLNKQLRAFESVEYDNRLPSTDELSACHIMYFSVQLDFDKYIYLIDKIKEQPILTISDRRNFVKQGGGIQFFTLERKLKFHINDEIVEQQRLVFSPALLRLSQSPG